ncbi:hypothetical protein SAMN05443572_10490 [Myxococcus fulvus]|uniref:Uncharacterized protein n=1 Tax=Myxococcus fulvus TaxID=33 RepID=A0ABY1CDN6_MYXFU|nr:hypothetical protein SAMN05443572_10490 [Myxococcus fulvus]
MSGHCGVSCGRLLLESCSVGLRYVPADRVKPEKRLKGHASVSGEVPTKTAAANTKARALADSALQKR